MDPGNPSNNIAYFFSNYPVLSEYFYHLEIDGLRNLGWNVHVFTFNEDKRSAEGTDSWDIAAEFIHQGRFLSGRMWLRVFGQCLSHPVKLFSLFVLFIRRLYSKPTQLAKTLAATAMALAHVSTIDEQDIQIVHGPWGTYTSIAAFVIHKIRPKIVFTMALVAYDYDSRFALIPDMVKASQMTFVISEARKQQVIEEWPRIRVPVECVYRGVQVVRDPYVREEREGIITVGTLLPYKGLHVLVEALSILKKQGVEVRARIIGAESQEDRSYAENLRKQVEQLRLADQMNLTGRMSHDQLLEAVAASEIFVLPSLYCDVLPNAVKEALSLKVPVIVTPTIGIDELVQDKESGLVVSKGDPHALADAIAWALRNPVEMRHMAQQGYLTLKEKFDIGRTSAQRSDFNRHLLAQQVG